MIHPIRGHAGSLMRHDVIPVGYEAPVNDISGRRFLDHAALNLLAVPVPTALGRVGPAGRGLVGKSGQDKPE